ncbi:energy-coupling factor ABC transporter ATP-binding protein [Radiobacillus kanasensis]|uniref:energy-coupling factor ABC transporter ATP-binding protein n=1 Tax=Radiobacillus kanasensis TaxID=2844358 RepID=UPI001E2A05C3|nr:energy-coupling factor ABC transporter ATP-binding protein [Radiobacillus kanasensis]UFT99525.1 energy-coupling factor ABC transporter ATP-binding protein [Radiobacillus kanasensis]
MDISFKQVSYIYQPNSPFEYQALKDLNLSIPSGSFVAIVGHTGSGKSTLIQHLNGLIRPTSGEVVIGPYRLSNEEKPKALMELRQRVGVVFQYPEHQLFEETVAKDIAFGPKNFGVSDADIQKRIQDVIQHVQLPEELLDRSPFDLSGGQMRRAAIAGVLAMNPEVLVLDEPTAGLDPRGQKDMMNMFHTLHKARNLTTILVTHSMEDAFQYSDYVIVLNDGEKYIEGKPEEVLTMKSALQEVQLDVPEMVQFIIGFNDKFHASLPLERQSLMELAQRMKQQLIKGEDQGE